ncbi:arginyl-tRNA synthetase, partial [mine drainage metagenome]
VEHTSTNPTGPIHVGRTRNSIVGDSLSRILKRYGYRVSTQYFVNDTGKQVIGLYLGYLSSENESLEIDNLLAGYRRIYKEIEEDKSREKDIESLIKKYESGEEAVVRQVREICTVMLRGIISSLARIGIKIDDYVWESGFLKSQEMDTVISS